MYAYYGRQTVTHEETPGEASERHVALSARRRSRQQQCSKETPEEASARRAANALRMRRLRKKQRAEQTPEEASARRIANAVRKRRSRQQQRPKETPEEITARRVADAARKRRYRQQQRAEETPEEASARRAANTARKRRYRQGKRAGETLERAAEERPTQAVKRDSVTPDEAAEWRAAESECLRRWQQQQRHAGMTNEHVEQRRIREALSIRQSCQQQCAGETLEKDVERHASELERVARPCEQHCTVETQLKADVQENRSAEAVCQSPLPQLTRETLTRETLEPSAQRHGAPSDGVTHCAQLRPATFRCSSALSQSSMTDNRYQVHAKPLLKYANCVRDQPHDPLPDISELFCCPGCEDVFFFVETLRQHLKCRTMLVTLPCETCARKRHFFNKCLAYAHVQHHFPDADVPKVESIVMRGSVRKYGPVPHSVAQELQQLEATVESFLELYCIRQVKEATENDNLRSLRRGESHDRNNLESDH